MSRTRCFVTFAIFLALCPLDVRAATDIQDSAGTTGSAQQAVDKTAQLEERVRALESRYEEASGFRDTDYILRIQKQYENYYQKAFETQKDTIWAVGLIFTAILALAGRFSFTMFEKKIEYAIGEARTKMNTDFEAKLAELQVTLQNRNQEQVTTAIGDLNEKTNRMISNINQKVRFNSHFSQALTFSHADRFKDASHDYGLAIGVYLENKDGGVSSHSGAVAVGNLFRSLFRDDKAKFEEIAGKELEKPLYANLQSELDEAAKLFPMLQKLLNKRLREGLAGGEAQSPEPA